MFAHARSTKVFVWTAIVSVAVLLCGCSGGGRAKPPDAPDDGSATAIRGVVSAVVPTPANGTGTQHVLVNGRVIAISAGHGGPRNTGAVHHDPAGNVDLVEKDLNLDIARRLNALMQAAGYGTVMIRDGDYSVSPEGGAETPEQIRVESQARADIANEHHADVLVVIHHNGSDDPLVSGLEVYYDPERSFGDKSLKLATAIHDALIVGLRRLPYDVLDRGVKDDAPIGQRYGQPHTYLFGEAPGFRATTMPAALGEALFVSNDTEAALLQRDDVQQAIAGGYRDGIEAYFRP
ncbi:MAG: N-acetylmuramoyl-L-alanine amidase [Chloroflexota bacterium]|nr:N-acetylmuramoyl-L-alanine amidase [Chloroflexota bacterium]